MSSCTNIPFEKIALQQTIKRLAPSGDPFPDFLIEHVEQHWRDVAIDLIDPDICMQVDSALSFCGCEQPSVLLRQFIYSYHQSDDFDYETIAQLVRVFEVAGDDAQVWDELMALEFERDCGLTREEYIAGLSDLAAALENFTEPDEVLMLA